MKTPHTFKEKIGSAMLRLRLLATTDIHGHIRAFDYFTDRTIQASGLTHLATVLEQARSQATNSMLFDNGDFLQGNPLCDYLADAQTANIPVHPVISTMNAMGYDAGTLGNHDFDFGLPFLERALSDAKFPIVSANLLTTRRNQETVVQEPSTLQPPYVLLRRDFQDSQGTTHSLNVGVIGFLPPQTLMWNRHHLNEKASAQEIVASAAYWVPKLREAGADIVIALAHTGIGPVLSSKVNRAAALGAVDGIDAIICGHTHKTFPSEDHSGFEGVDIQRGTLQGTPSVMPGAHGSHLGVIDLTLNKDALSKWQVTQHKSSLLPIQSTTPADQQLETLTDPEHLQIREHLNREIGQTPVALHSFFALVSNAPALKLVASAQCQHVRAAIAGSEWAELPMLSAVSPLRTGGDGKFDGHTHVPAGPLLVRHIADLYKYPNLIAAICLTGKDLRAWLESTADIFNVIDPSIQSVAQALLNPNVPGYRFDVICGLTYQFDVSRMGRNGASNDSRLSFLHYKGEPVTDDMRFVVATNSYRAATGWERESVVKQHVIYDGDENIRDILQRYVQKENTNLTPDASVWSIKPMGGVPVFIDTDAHARPFLADLPYDGVDVLSDEAVEALRVSFRI